MIIRSFSAAEQAAPQKAAPPQKAPEPEDKFSLTKTMAGGVLFFMGRRIPTTVPEVTPERATEMKAALKPGDVVLTCDCAYPGWARMEFWTVRSNYTHAAYCGADGKIYEAVGGGVLVSETEDYFKGRMKAAIIRPPYASPEQDIQAATDYCKSHLGKDYDSTFNTADDSEFYCSELVHKALKSMPHPIDSPVHDLFGKPAVAPDAFLSIEGATMIWDDKSDYWGNKLGHWPLALAAVGSAATGAAAGGVTGACIGFGAGLLGSIMIGNKIQVGKFLPSLDDLTGGKHSSAQEQTPQTR